MMRRIAKYKTKYVDYTIGTEEVFQKYKGICQKCGCKTFRIHPPQDDTASLDHIIPLSKGGSHTWDNVTLLCHKCNIGKNDNVYHPHIKKEKKQIKIVSKLMFDFKLFGYRAKLYREAK